MALCGFNKKMLDGLMAFNEGLVEHGLMYRSGKNGESIDQAIKREISDMTRLLLELHIIDDVGKRVITEGMVKYAMGFYLLMRKIDISLYHDLVNCISDYFYFMDEEYYSSLEGKWDDMKQLASRLNKKNI